MTSYTTGNWTIESLYVDSISTPKTLSLPDFSWATDWHEASKPRSRNVSNGTIESYFGNVTGPSVADVEHITFNYRDVQNVYADLPIDIDSTSQAAQKNGRSSYRQMVMIYKATNSVSGQEIYIPIKGSINLVVPSSPLVQSQLITDAVGRLLSSLFGTGKTDVSQILDELRRDLDPTR